MINIDHWTNIDPNSDDAAGIGYSRLSYLFRNDPFVRMLSTEAIDGLLAAIFSPAGHGVAVNDHLRVRVPADVHEDIKHVFSMSPLAIVNEGFIAHVSDLTVKALFPKGEQAAA